MNKLYGALISTVMIISSVDGHGFGRTFGATFLGTTMANTLTAPRETVVIEKRVRDYNDEDVRSSNHSTRRKMNDLKEENESLRKKNKKLQEKYDKLADRIDTLEKKVK